MLKIYKFEEIDYEEKECRKCNEIFPTTTEHFYKQLIRTKTKGDFYRLTTWCKECISKRNTEWAKKNRDVCNEANRKYFQSQKGRTVRKNDNSKERLKRWQNKNPEKVKSYRVKRQKHKTHIISKEEWENCKNYFNYRCAYCDIKIEDHFITYAGQLKWTDFHKEHVDDEGANDLSNCAPSCKSCNSSKGEYKVVYWLEMSEMYSKEKVDKLAKWLNKDYKNYIEVSPSQNTEMITESNDKLIANKT